jgi:uncharacterized protein (TIGR02594 family)
MSEQVPFFMATDEIAIDSSAPWMEIAYREMKKGAKEFKTQDTFTKLFYVSLVQDEIRHGTKHPLLQPVLEDMVNAELKAEKDAVANNNAAIAKFIATVRTDPKYGKPSPLPVISHDSPKTLAAKGKQGQGATAHWQVTAWCASFVNWCLQEAGSPYLGYATASSWLNFGTPIASPVSGCITVLPPMSSTGGGTGHVGFFVKQKGALTFVLGGNQNDEINVTGFKAKPVGYRWPTRFNHLLASSSRIA